MKEIIVTKKMQKLINLVSKKDGDRIADEYLSTFTKEDVENVLFEINFKNREYDGLIYLWKGISNIYLIIALAMANAH